MTIGVSHESAPIHIRESLAFKPSEIGEFLRTAKRSGLIVGGVLLSTCNRMELTVEYSADYSFDYCTKHLLRFLLEYKKLPYTQKKYFFSREETTALPTLFLLLSGFSSMVRGETQIVSQVKEALTISRTSGFCTTTLLKLFEKALEVGKKIRSTQKVSYVNSSAGAAAVSFLSTLDPKESFINAPHLILGAGEMATTLVKALKKQAVKTIHLYNRTEERTIRFAQKHGLKVYYSKDQLAEAISKAKYIWVATSASAPIVTPELLGTTINDRERTFFDLAVPRNIAPEIVSCPQNRVYCIDDLRGETSSAKPSKEIQSLLETATKEFQSWRQTLSSRGLYTIIREDIEATFAKELSKLAPSLDTPTRAILEKYTQQLTERVSAQMIGRLRKMSEQTNDSIYEDIIRDLFTQHNT